MNQLAICVPVIDQRALTTSTANATPAPSASQCIGSKLSVTPSRPMAATFVVSEGAAATISVPAATAVGSATVVPNPWRCTRARGTRVLLPARTRTDLIVSAHAPSMSDMHTGYRHQDTPAMMSSAPTDDFMRKGRRATPKN